MNIMGLAKTRPKTRAWVPSHITGFFAAHRKDDPLHSGSVGCGLCLSLGATTTIESAPEIQDTEIILNGAVSGAPVSRFVVEKLTKIPIRVRTELEMPFGAGFGASGAGALGCAYSLNAHFDLGLTADRAACFAHEAEVVNGTGLGDVIAQNTGGLVVRLEPGGPGIGRVDRIPVPPLPLNYVVRGPISTRDVLSDKDAMMSVNLAGVAALKELLKRPTLRNFMVISKRFTVQSDLASDWALNAIEAVEAAGGMASMIMLGDAVFAFGGAEALSDFGEVHTTTISREVLILTDIPKSHPRYASLVARERVAEGVKNGFTSNQGLIAQGRGECFDYLLGERTTPSAATATRAAVALLLLAERPALSVNGNVAALVPEEMVALANALRIPLEVNLFHRSEERVKKIADLLREKGAKEVLGEKPDASVPGLEHARALATRGGIFDADVVLIPLEDGDRCEALVAMGKKVIAIDLNPLSRTARKATVSIVDNILRAVPNLTEQAGQLSAKTQADLEKIVKDYDNQKALAGSVQEIRDHLDRQFREG